MTVCNEEKNQNINLINAVVLLCQLKIPYLNGIQKSNLNYTIAIIPKVFEYHVWVSSLQIEIHIL